jgi:mitochondrial-processing peptidase subunit beta
VYIGSGSRHETLATSGVSYALRNMLTRGTSSHSAAAFHGEVDAMGARLHGDSQRETTSLGMTVFRGDASRAVKLLGSAVTEASLDAGEFELLKQELAAEHARSHAAELQHVTLENAHYNAYRDHMLGQPARGDADTLPGLTVDDLRTYQAANYFGENLVVVGTGNLNHAEFAAQVEQAFGAMQRTGVQARANTDQAVYVPALLFIRDDEMVNSNVAVFYDAPGLQHEDYYGFLLLKHIYGSYRIDKHAQHLNDVKKQYNSMHALLGDLVDVTMAESHYFAYSDTGLFGNYFFGNEVFTRQMNYCGVCLPTVYGHYVNDVEVVRGRNHLWNQLMAQESGAAINAEVGRQLLTQGRRVHRSEVAARVSHMDNNHLKHLAYKWFYDAEPSFTNWGPIETMTAVGSYKYYKINTMSTVFNTHHTLFT